MIGLWVGILFFLLIIQSVTPFIIQKTTVFGVSIPEPFQDNDHLAQLKKQFVKHLAWLEIPLIVLTTLLLLNLEESLQVIVFIVVLFIQITIDLTLYLRFYHRVMHYKEAQGWEQQVEIVHVSQFETKFKQQPFPHFLFLPQLIIPVVLGFYLFSLYDALPETIPTHWNLRGVPDAWSDKSVVSVGLLPFIILFTWFSMYVIAYFINRSSFQLKAQATDQSLKREVEYRKVNIYMLAAMSLLTASFMAMIDIVTTRQIFVEDQLNAVILMLGMPALFIGIFLIIFWTMRATKRINATIPIEDSMESQQSDDQFWKWGLFYFNKDNPDLFVEKKYGVGWTINFARPAVVIFFLLLLVVPLLPLFFL